MKIRERFTQFREVVRTTPPVLTPPKPPQYAITLEVAGVVVKYLAWDRHEVWRWTKSPNKCALFTSVESARHEAECCSMSYRYRYNIRKLD